MLFVYLKISSKKARQDRLFITTLSVNTCRYYTYNIYQSIYLYNIYTSAMLIAYNVFSIWWSQILNCSSFIKNVSRKNNSDYVSYMNLKYIDTKSHFTKSYQMHRKLLSNISKNLSKRLYKCYKLPQKHIIFATFWVNFINSQVIISVQLLLKTYIY